MDDTKSEFVSLPDSFFTQVMPQVQDISELKVVLNIFYLMHSKQHYFECSSVSAGASEMSEKQSQFVTYEELRSHYKQWGGEQSNESLRQTLNSAVEHGIILYLPLIISGKREHIYFVNSESNKRFIESIERGELSFEKPAPDKGEKGENIFVLYERNIGIITPIIAEELKEAEGLYPHQWIEEAFKEAVVRNKRSWKYIARILERWTNEGKDSGEYTRSIKKGDSDKYIGGKYGHLVKR